LAALALLLLGGFFSWMLAGLFPGEGFTQDKPAGGVRWAVIVLFCLCTGYWEEGVFRVYFLTVCRRAGVNIYASVLLSTVVFAWCHAYEGPAGMINAGFAGILLSAVYIKTDSYHGLALAHAAYNILAYLSF
jgi:membrane protease YdiL (CAAX protease family)